MFVAIATCPMELILKRDMPVLLAMESKFAVWFAAPKIFKVVLPVCAPCKNANDVEVADGAMEKLEPENKNAEVELVKVKARLDVAPPPI